MPTGASELGEASMVQAIEDARRRVRNGIRPDPAPQPGCRAVAAGRHVAGPRRHRRRRRDLRTRRLLQARPQPRLRRHHHPVQPGGASRPGHGRRRIVPGRPAGGHRRAAHADLPAGRHAGDDQRRSLRPHRRGARPPAPVDRGSRRDRGDGLQRSRGRSRRRRPGRGTGLRRGRTTGDRQPQAACRASWWTPSTDWSACSTAAR